LKLETLSVIPLEPNSELYEIDINNDGQNEWLNVPLDQSEFGLYQEGFKDMQSFDFPNSNIKSFYYGIIKTAQGNQLYIQKSEYYYTFNYFKNPYYYFKYLSYLIIYVLVLGFEFLIIKGQKIRTKKQRAMENEIVELQLKTIKNQVDPHFVFNAINTISGLMLTDKKLEADEFICNFSDLMRSTLQKSDKVFCSLQEEIDYVKKYIKLQQVRFNQQFKYQLKIESTINLSRPKIRLQINN
jgi:Histidine kinase